MKKIIAVSLILFATLAFGVIQHTELDKLIQINWALKGYEPILDDAEMSGYNDTSVVYEIPEGTVGMTFFWLADTGTTRDSVGDADSIIMRGYLLPRGIADLTPGYTQFWANAFGDIGIFDSTVCDTGSGISTVSRMLHTYYANDSFFVSRVIPPPDTAGGSAALRVYYATNRYPTKYDIQFYAHCSTADTANVNSRYWMIFHSAFNNGCNSALGQVGLNKK